MGGFPQGPIFLMVQFLLLFIVLQNWLTQSRAKADLACLLYHLLKIRIWISEVVIMNKEKMTVFPHICLCKSYSFCCFNITNPTSSPISMSECPGQTQISVHYLLLCSELEYWEPKQCTPTQWLEAKSDITAPSTRLTVCIRGWQTFYVKCLIVYIVGFSGNIGSLLQIL